jgi:hypothetical protein
MLATHGDDEQALAELRAIRPAYANTLSEDSTMVISLDEQTSQLLRR